MQLRGIDFGNVWAASGALGWEREGYWFHPLLRRLGVRLDDITLVSKTVTLLGRRGNMPLNARQMPRWPFPRCIRVQFGRGMMLNAVGLSGFGLGYNLGMRYWLFEERPFFISVMPVSGTADQRLEEMQIIVDMLAFARDYFRADFGLQINLSCPNTSHDPAGMIAESVRILEVAGQLDVPLMPKYSIASAPIAAIMELEQLPHCDAICVSNTIPYDRGVSHAWGRATSPLNHLGNGGLSGAPLRPMVCDWIKRLREAGFTKPINGGGGIMRPSDVDAYHQAGASSVFLGTVVSLRPWRVNAIIDRANSIAW